MSVKLPDGVIVIPSTYTVKKTTDLIQTFLEGHGSTIYARIDQKKEAARAGVILRDLEFLLFGNPAVGGHVMIQNPLTALDLPLKLIVWEDKENKVSIAYNDSSYIIARYQLPANDRVPISLDNLVLSALAASEYPY